MCVVPKISEEVRAARRAHILDAARACFLTRGFHQTSMDDILRAADVSAGAAYRYFAGKGEIIEAVAGETVTGLTSRIESMAAEDPPPNLPDVMRRLVHLIDDVADDSGRLALIVWGEAQTDPVIGELARGELLRLRRVLQSLVAQSEPGNNATPESAAAVVYSLLAGFLVQRRVIGSADAEAYAATAAALVSDL